MDNSNNKMTTPNSSNPGAPRDRKIHPLVATAAPLAVGAPEFGVTVLGRM